MYAIIKSFLAEKHILLIIAIMILFSGAGQQISGQIIIDPGKKYLTDFHFRVKQFNEFVDRFNFVSDFRGEVIDDDFKSKISRRDYLKSLFNLQDPRLNPAVLKDSSEYPVLVNQFINQVMSEKRIINKHSSLIIAEAKTKILFNKKPETVSVFLNQEMAGEGMYKWVISSVHADFLKIGDKDSAFIRFISPISHEMDFINLRRAMEDRDHLIAYAGENYNYDELDVFFYNVHTGSISVDYVMETIYYIFDLPGWCIKVKDFNRSGPNSGWLIDNLYKTNEEPFNFLDSL